MSAAAVKEVGLKEGGLMAAPTVRRKRSRASLIGGCATGGGVFALTLALAGGPSATSIVIGSALGAALAIWVRLADL
ncbi:MAG: hypothetical protein ACHQF3_15230 [Alphaproteobacteria bacterium]